MNRIRQWWDALTPRNRQFVVIGTLLAALVLLMTVTRDGAPPPPPPPPAPNETVLFGSGSQEMTLNSVATQLSNLSRNVDSLSQQLKTQHEQVQQVQATLQSNGDVGDGAKTIYNLQRQLQAQAEQLRALDDKLKQAPMATAAPGAASPGAAPDAATSSTDNPFDIEGTGSSGDPIKPLSSTDSSAISNATVDLVRQARAKEKESAADPDKAPEEGQNKYITEGTAEDGSTPAPRALRIIDQAEPVVPETPDKPELRGARILAGALIPVQLLNGVIAPATGRGNERQTGEYRFGTWRVTGPAAMPNGKRIDLEGCLITSDAQGEMASSTVHFRSQRITCDLDGFGQVDVPVQATVSGPGGAGGIKGHLVNQGDRILWMTMAANAFSGLGQQTGNLAGAGSVRSRSYGDTSETVLPDASSVLAGMGGNMVAGASNTVSDYLLEIAQQLAPVIEVKPFVEGTFHVAATFQLEQLQDQMKSTQRGPRQVGNQRQRPTPQTRQNANQQPVASTRAQQQQRELGTPRYNQSQDMATRDVDVVR